jgi:hypothetical protein
MALPALILTHHHSSSFIFIIVIHHHASSFIISSFIITHHHSYTTSLPETRPMWRSLTLASWWLRPPSWLFEIAQKFETNGDYLTRLWAEGPANSAKTMVWRRRPHNHGEQSMNWRQRPHNHSEQSVQVYGPRALQRWRQLCLAASCEDHQRSNCL